MDNTILYNPECSKSRELLSIIKNINIKFKKRDYLLNPLSTKETIALLSMLDLPNPKTLLRAKPDSIKFSKTEGNSTNLIADIISSYPELLQRPILTLGKKALIARPPTLAIDFISRHLKAPQTSETN